MIPDQVRLKVLDLAEEGANALFHILAEWRWENSVVHPQTTREETRSAVEELIRAGHVEVHAVRAAADDRPLDDSEALAVVGDDRNWEWPGPEGAEAVYELGITTTGEAEYWRLRRGIEAAAGG